jgi:glutamate dehydrogenase/leucine dehydrogenase
MTEDVLRLATAMAYKSAFHDLGFSGGKMTVQLSPGADMSVAYAAIGEFVAGLGGRFVTGEDVGTSPEKIALMARTAKNYVLGLPTDAGGSGDPSPLTALGIAHGVQGVLRDGLGYRDISGRTVFVKGAGHVGAEVVRLLVAEGVSVYLTDIAPDRLAPFHGQPTVRIVSDWPSERVDVFCPCAKGGDIDFGFDRARAIAGAANNQLSADEVADELHAKGIIYVPDWVINGGGLISLAAEYHKRPHEWAVEKAHGIGERVSELLARSRTERKSLLAIAYDIAHANM